MKMVLFSCALLTSQLVVAQSSHQSQAARGRYLVQNVAMCGDCHTPRDEKGNPLPGKELSGAPLAFKPLAPMPWADAAPPIAGLPSWNDEDAVKFFMTGKYQGQAPRPPMPEYHLSAADARAVVAYLRTLGETGSKSRKGTQAKKD